MTDGKSAPEDGQRVDRWLWFARIFKSRSLATRAIAETGVRVTRAGLTLRIDKPAFALRINDVVTLKKSDDVRMLEVTALGSRRGPASEAQGLYRELTPPRPPASVPSPSPRPATRPSKKDRRALDRLKGQAQFDED